MTTTGTQRHKSRATTKERERGSPGHRCLQLMLQCALRVLALQLQLLPLLLLLLPCALHVLALLMVLTLDWSPTPRTRFLTWVVW